MEQKDYWNNVSETKQFTTPFQAGEFSNYLNLNAVILDVGCGYGRTLDELHHFGYRHLIGMDFSQGMIERGKQQAPYLDLRLKKDAGIDLPDHSIDAVILFAVLTCIRSNEEQQALISEINRVLKPAGILYINDFLINSDERNQARYQKFEAKYGIYGVFELPEGAVLRHHSEKWLKELLADFSTLKYERLTFTTMNGHKSNGFYFIGRKLS
ncbi:methyltransferase [Clostridium sp. W14A]|uniref:Class I SAM-dependent methyltransferase n=1 Tax=Caproicibacter fermentans TaxID=2576756 RepID=A0A7G8TDI9_9FIRM|nr:class I SAM-dependent methyltransferase [Caproicibacter fermentans]OCN00739.1 methyltransferase [Clostridium sp. W14A]QNK41680.1 class I SAM-dependent methyltransferase [Caproicibacter fermentans]